MKFTSGSALANRILGASRTDAAFHMFQKKVEALCLDRLSRLRDLNQLTKETLETLVSQAVQFAEEHNLVPTLETAQDIVIPFASLRVTVPLKGASMLAQRLVEGWAKDLCWERGYRGLELMADLCKTLGVQGKRDCLRGTEADPHFLQNWSLAVMMCNRHMKTKQYADLGEVVAHVKKLRLVRAPQDRGFGLFVAWFEALQGEQGWQLVKTAIESRMPSCIEPATVDVVIGRLQEFCSSRLYSLICLSWRTQIDCLLMALVDTQYDKPVTKAMLQSNEVMEQVAERLEWCIEVVVTDRDRTKTFHGRMGLEYLAVAVEASTSNNETVSKKDLATLKVWRDFGDHDCRRIGNRAGVRCCRLQTAGGSGGLPDGGSNWRDRRDSPLP